MAGQKSFEAFHQTIGKKDFDSRNQIRRQFKAGLVRFPNADWSFNADDIRSGKMTSRNQIGGERTGRNAARELDKKKIVLKSSYLRAYFVRKGIGKLVVGLFGKPYAGSENSELWNEALKEIAEQINRQLLSEGAKNGQQTGHKPRKSSGKSPINDSDEPLGVIESIPNEFVRGLQMGSVHRHISNLLLLGGSRNIP